MRQDQIDVLIERISLGEFYEEYAEYIMKHAGDRRVICNGDTLLEAMEDGFLIEEFAGFLFARGH